MHHRNRLCLASALPFLALSLLAPNLSAAQSSASGNPACQVSRFRLEFITGGDDLRGGQNNLNIEIHLFNGRVQTFADVNRSANWGNNSRHVVDLDLHPPTAASEISYVRLIHLAQSELVISPETVASPLGVASGVKTQDNWDMTRVTISAQEMAGTVGEAGPFRFTGDNTQLSVHLRFPPNACNSNGASTTGRSLPGAVMTNQDVMRMASAGVPESAIVAAITRSRPQFDFSPAAQQELTHAGVSPALLRAMHEQGTPNADDLNPQPYPPKGVGIQPSASAARKISLPANLHVLAGPEVRNPAAQAPPLAAPPVVTLAPPAPARSRSRYALAPTTRVCTGPAAITSVVANGAPAPLQFTPDGNTEYIITGCGFGTTPGQVALTGNFAAHGGRIALLPYHPFGVPAPSGWGTHWSDSRIEAMVDPSVSGELDLASVALLLTPASGPPLNRANFAFRARRGSPVMLSHLPASAFCQEHASQATCNAPGWVSSGNLNSPCGAWIKQACAIEVLRTPADQVISDTFTLHLKPGFSVSSASILVGTPQGSEAGAIPAPILRGNIIIVQPPVGRLTADPKSPTFSLYGLRIFVVGPVGVADAWDGQ